MRALKAGLTAAFVLGGVAATIGTTFSAGCGNTSQVRQVFTALDGTGDRPRDTFFTDSKQIFCDAVISAYSKDETVNVQFIEDTGEATMFDGTNVIGPVSRLWAGGEFVPTPGVSTVSFSLDPPHEVDGGLQVPFPVGHWKCIIYINGEKGGEADFKVIYPTPDCPASGGAYDGLNCAAYQANAACPVDSNYQPGGTQCTCQAADAVPDPATRVFQCK